MSYNPASSCFHLAHMGGDETRTCFYVNKRLEVEQWEYQAVNGDYCRLKIKVKSPVEGENCELWIHNVYNPSPGTKTWTDEEQTYRKLSTALDMPREHILLGDFNLHHPRWNNPGRTTHHDESDRLLGMIENRGMELALPAGRVTWTARKFESAIDLVFVSQGTYSALESCRVREVLHFGSDHLPVLTEVPLGMGTGGGEEKESVEEARKRRSAGEGGKAGQSARH